MKIQLLSEIFDMLELFLVPGKVYTFFFFFLSRILLRLKYSTLLIYNEHFCKTVLDFLACSDSEVLVLSCIKSSFPLF